MVRTGLLVVGVIVIAALCATTARADIRIGVAGPMTGSQAWFGEQFERGAGMAVADLNAKGGVLGQEVELIVGTTSATPIRRSRWRTSWSSDGVVFVAGHWCSHSSIAASKVYEDAGVLMITPSSASAKLTDEGGPNVFRVYGRDDRQGDDSRRPPRPPLGGQGDRDPGRRHDVWGAGVADAVKAPVAGARRHAASWTRPHSVDELEYADMVSKMQAGGVDVLFLGGYHHETGLILRQARDRGYDLPLIAYSAVALADFPIIVGPELDGTLMVAAADMRSSPRRGRRRSDFGAQGHEPAGVTLNAYAAVQVWAQAVDGSRLAGSRCGDRAMHSRQFDTVLGRIGFDEKATSPASSRGNGSSGRTAATCRRGLGD